MNNTITDNLSQQTLSPFSVFAAIERESKDSIIIKKMYVRICDDDLVAGLLLSHIVYWFGHSLDGSPRAKHKYQGKTCVVRQRSDWWDECCISSKQYDRAIALLKDKGYVTVETHKSPFHKGETAAFIFINENELMKAIFQDIKEKENGQPAPVTSDKQGGNLELPKGEFRNSPKGNSGITETVTPIYTENTTKNTSNKNTPPNPQRGKGVPASSSSSSEEKNSFGDDGFVKLTPKQYAELLKHMTEDERKYWIDQINLEVGKQGESKFNKKYASHYHTILSWKRMRQEKGQDKFSQIAPHRRNSKLLIPADLKPSTYKREEL